MAPINGGYSACSTGPVIDPTPEDSSSHHVSITDASALRMTNYGPPYGVPYQGDSSGISASDSAFSHLENKLAHKPGVSDPAALAYEIGRKELGKAEMTRRSVAGRKD